MHIGRRISESRRDRVSVTAACMKTISVCKLRSSFSADHITLQVYGGLVGGREDENGAGGGAGI